MASDSSGSVSARALGIGGVVLLVLLAILFFTFNSAPDVVDVPAEPTIEVAIESLEVDVEVTEETTPAAESVDTDVDVVVGEVTVTTH